jgi:hypothetical protein
MAIVATGSLIYSDHASALDSSWAWLALVWAVAYVGLAEVGVRRHQAVAGRVTLDRPKPKSVWRRLERWLVGIVMAVIAYALEKMVMRGIKKAGKDKETKEELAHDAHLQGRRGGSGGRPLAAFADQVHQQREQHPRRDDPEHHRDPSSHTIRRTPRSWPSQGSPRPPVSEIARRRPARRIVVSSVAARKLTSSFCPGRAPISRSTASTTFWNRTRNRWA